MSTKHYQECLKKAMDWLNYQPNTLFIGQAVRYAGTGCYDSLVDIADYKKIEFPVAENFQIGVSTGLALNGFVPITIVPRWNFLLCATDQIINHLDKFSIINPNCRPKVIIRVAVGSEIPVDPQSQHKGNFSNAFRSMCDTIDIIECDKSSEIMSIYQHAYSRTDGRSTIVVEFPDYEKKAPL